jgi:hypothetical protein
MLRVSLVYHRKREDQRYVLEDTQQHSSSHKTGKVFDQARACHDNSPADDKNAQVG